MGCLLWYPLIVTSMIYETKVTWAVSCGTHWLWHPWYTRLRWHGLSPVVPMSNSQPHLIVSYDKRWDIRSFLCKHTTNIGFKRCIFYITTTHLGEMLYFKWITTECTNHEWLGHIYTNALCSVSPRRRVGLHGTRRALKWLQTILKKNSCGKV